jgi:hypothetical protein
MLLARRPIIKPLAIAALHHPPSHTHQRLIRNRQHQQEAHQVIGVYDPTRSAVKPATLPVPNDPSRSPSGAFHRLSGAVAGRCVMTACPAHLPVRVAFLPCTTGDWSLRTSGATDSCAKDVTGDMRWARVRLRAAGL